MSYEEHIKLMEKANREYYNYHESILLAKQIIEKQKKLTRQPAEVSN
ncbi:hypothetical protein [Enterococcus avium]|nr:hypothetical protein [Enterococcus avium]MDT2565171.1 hypothetical protein [Enterococcus avium]